MARELTKEEKLTKWVREEFGRQRAQLVIHHIQMAGLIKAMELLTSSVAELELLVEKLTTARQRKAAKKRVSKEMNERKEERKENAMKKIGEGLTPEDMMHKYGGFKP